MTTLAAPTTAERTAGWFPSRWGPDDQAGALNEITPDVVLAAVGLVRTGGYTTSRTCCTPTSQPSPGVRSGPT
jgi:hypothetical protein